MSIENHESNGVSEELRMAAEIGAPSPTPSPHVRLPFPLIALPTVLRRFVQQASDALGVPPGCVATPAIATCASAIGNTCRIRLKKSWSEPCVIWAVTLMESGSLKSPSYHAAVAPLHAMQRLWVEQYDEDQKAFRKAKALFEADATIWKSSQCPDASQGPPDEPVEPKPVDLFTDDTTVEALVGLLANNPRGLALTRDELSGFFGSFGAYKGGRGGDEAAYLEFYNAKPKKVNRAGGKRLYAHYTALSIFGTCQPAVFRNLIGMTGRGSNQVENGLASRFLIAAPEATPQCWHEEKAFDPTPYHHLVGKLLKIPMPKDADGRAEPAYIDLLPEAAEQFQAFVTQHGAYTETIENVPLRYHYRKLAAVAARLALIFCLCDAVTQPPEGPAGVQEQHVLAGITLARWYGREARRFYEGCDTQADREQREQQQLQQELLEKIRAHGGTITPRAMGRIRRRWADPQAAERALRDLELAGHGKCVTEPAEGSRGRPSFYFQLFEHPVGEHAVVEQPVPEPVVDNNAETPEMENIVNAAENDAAADYIPGITEGCTPD